MPRLALFLAWAPFFSGAERAFLPTVSHLDTRRYDPYVIAGTDGELAARIRERGIPCEVHALRYFDRRALPSWVRSVGTVLRAARRVRPALVHSNDVPSFQLGAYVARWLRIPALTHVRFPDDSSGFRWQGSRGAVFVSEALRDDATKSAPGLAARERRRAPPHAVGQQQPFCGPCEIPQQAPGQSSSQVPV